MPRCCVTSPEKGRSAGLGWGGGCSYTFFSELEESCGKINIMGTVRA